MADEPTAIITQDPNPLSLIQQALTQGVDPERLKQLMDLQERWEANKAKRAFAEAMSRCQEKMPVVVKDKWNDITKSMYARLETVSAAIRPIYTAEGFALSYGEDVSPIEGHRRIICDVIHREGHEKQFHLDSKIDDVGMKGSQNKTSVQGLGSMVSYLRRYLTLMIFNIATAESDDDGNGAVETISETAVETLNKMIDACRVAGNPVDMKRFLKLVGVSDGGTLSDVTQSKFLTAVDSLTLKLSQKATVKA